MRRIAFINEKGGTCKTTLCVNVAARLAARGRRVLVADLDTQGHAAKALGVDPRRLSPTVHEWLLGAAPFGAVVRRTAIPGLDLLPANRDLAGFPVAAAALPEREEAAPPRPRRASPRARTTRCSSTRRRRARSSRTTSSWRRGRS